MWLGELTPDMAIAVDCDVKHQTRSPGCVEQLVTCLTADPGVVSSIPPQSHTFAEIDGEIISMTILPSADSRRGCCQLQAKMCAQSTG